MGAALELHHILSKHSTAYTAYSFNRYGELLHGQAQRNASIFAVGWRQLF